MGGKAIQKIIPDATRVDRQGYERVAEVLDESLQQTPVPWHICRQLKSKQDFGDIDVIIGCSKPDFERWAKEVHGLIDLDDYLRRVFNSQGQVHNTNMVSWGMRCPGVFDGVFQVDFIFTDPEDFVMSSNYFAYNDLNLFVGALFHSIGMKFGFDGLNYVYEDDKGRRHKKCVSKDISRIYGFAGLDIDRYHRGFDTVVEVFQYVSTSRLFHPSIFMPESLNSVNRSRNKKRKNYEAFMQWLEENYASQLRRPRPFRADRGQVLQQVKEHFPETDIDLEIRWVDHLREEQDLCSDILSGRHIKKKTGLTDRALGMLIKDWQQYVEDRTGLDYRKAYMSWGPKRTRQEFDSWNNVRDVHQTMDHILFMDWDQDVFLELLHDVTSEGLDEPVSKQKVMAIFEKLFRYMSQCKTSSKQPPHMGFRYLLPLLQSTRRYSDDAELLTARLRLVQYMTHLWPPTAEMRKRLSEIV